ncbi:cobalt-precorrin-6A reductase [Paracoccus halophilus]|nr:cobalt-precorrin-6A reductase [Paracoccus halophilus]
MTRILLLGGTSEARAMAQALAGAGMDAIYSYAGRVQALARQPLPMRVGGFGGVDGLAAYLRAERITHLIDATHPFAALISRNALVAAQRARVPLIVLERPPWAARPEDRWTHVPDFAAAAEALPGDGSGVFLAIGRQHLAPFLSRHHRWLLRFAEIASHPLRDATLIVSRGPFTVAGDKALMQRHDIGWLVTKNSGGRGAAAKLTAARELGLPIIVIDRPALPARRIVGTVAEVMGWLHGADRGV